MHNIVYLAISKVFLPPSVQPDHIKKHVDKVMRQYTEESAANQESIKCDWYVIGGRWDGILAAEKDTTGVYPSESGVFSFDSMQAYDIIVNAGNSGPYIAGKKTFIPVAGAFKRDIVLNAEDYLRTFYLYKLYSECLSGNENYIGLLPEGAAIQPEGLIVEQNGKKVVMLKRNEQFEDYISRLGKVMHASISAPDAYVDMEGRWHDLDEIWKTRGKELFGRGENPDSYAQ